MKKIILGLAAVVTGIALMPLFAAFEAHVVNVTAEIENALYVHPESRTFGTVFPQEYLKTHMFIAFSESFSSDDQTRVGTIEYVIKEKPKPREDTPDERAWCEENAPQNSGDPDDPYYDRCFPSLCAYLSKTPDGEPDNDTGIPPFHDPDDPANYAIGKLVKFPDTSDDVADTWTIDLPVPCFKGYCAQDWSKFVWEHNPDVDDPYAYMLPSTLEHETFGCDLWVEVTDIY